MNRILAFGVATAVSGLSACSSTPKTQTAPTPAPSTRSAPAPTASVPTTATPAPFTPPSDLVASTAFHPSRLVASKDSFVAAAGVQVLGSAVLTVMRETPNARYVVDLDFQGGMIRQHYDGRFNASTLMPVSMETSVNIQGAPLNTRITIADGRAKGTAQDPGPAGVTSTNVDLAVPAGTVDDQAVGALILTLDLAEGFKTSFKSLATTPTEMRANDLSVLGKETVTVPAGTFETYRVLIHSKEDVTIFVTTAAPRRAVLLRIGNGIELRLVK